MLKFHVCSDSFIYAKKANKNRINCIRNYKEEIRMTKEHHGSKGCVSLNQSASLEQCENVIVTPDTTTPGIIRVPVVLQELRVRTTTVANINFPDPVLEIKDIKKRVKIVQCRLLLTQNSFESALGVPLFIKGFIRKNIQYATPCPHSESDCVASQLRSLTVDVPFECVTTVTEFLNAPVLPDFNSRSEFDYFRAQKLGHGFPEKDELLSSDLSQFHQESTQFYNQLPFCELVQSDILQWDEAVDRYPLPGNAPFEEGTFYNIVQKTLLEFTIKILQNQQVAINGNGTGGVGNPGNGGC
jgi:hypothetical protein